MCTIESVSKIANYLKVLPGNINYNNEKVLSRTTKGKTVSGFATVLLSIANESKEVVAKNSVQSLEIECQVQQWIDYAVLYVAPGSKDKHVAKHLLNDINIYLHTRSYFVDHFLTLADLAVFHAIFDLMRSLSPIEKENYLNLSRWFDHLQQNDKIRQGADLVNFTTIYLHGWATGTHI